MLSLELCKKLKAAGFPQLHNHNNNSDFDKLKCFKSANEKLFGDEIYCPTLSELIKACGNKFDCLKKVQFGGYKIPIDPKDIKDGYIAYSINDNLLKDSSCLDQSGETPEKAVAKLWLALNKKK